MTPLERAARDRLTRYLAARDKYAAHARALGANPEHVPGDAIDNQADTAEVLPIPGPGGLLGGHLFPRPGSASFPLRERDLRLVLAALDRHDSIAGSVLDTARQVAAHAGRFGPVPERVEVTYQAAATGRELCNAALSHTSGRIRCQLAVSSPLPEGYLEHGGRYTGNRNHWEKHWHEDEHGQVRTWTDNETEGA